MAVTVDQLARQFQRRTDLLSQSIESGKRANRARRLNRNALGALYEASLLSLTKGLETFLEEYFFALLVDVNVRRSVDSGEPRVSFRSRAELERFFDLEKSYLDWLPWKSHSAPRAERFFPEGSPFDRLNRAPQEKETLSINHIMRNAVAHQSGTAAIRFLQLDGVSGFRSRFRRPGISEVARSSHPNGDLARA